MCDLFAVANLLVVTAVAVTCDLPVFFSVFFSVSFSVFLSVFFSVFLSVLSLFHACL